MPAKKTNSDDPGPEPLDLSFEDALGELERIVADLENGALGLEQSLKAYELGVKRLRECHRKLESFEHRVELLTGFSVDGTPETEPFGEAENSSLEEKQASRGQRRSSRRTDLDRGDANLF